MPRPVALFDFDGTLADSFGWFAQTLRELAPRYRLSALDEAQIAALRGLEARAILRRLGISWWKLPLLTRDMRTRMRNDIARIAMFPGIPEALAQLAAEGWRLGIVSSNSEANIRAVLGPSMAHVELCECGAAIFGKPAKLKKALARLGAAPAEACYIGDEIRDAEAAGALGMRFVGVAWGYTTPAALQRASAETLCDSTHFLPGILRMHANRGAFGGD